MQANRTMFKRVENDWLRDFLEATHRHYNRAIVSSSRIHSSSSFRENLFSEYIGDRASNFDTLIMGDSNEGEEEGHKVHESRYETLKTIYSEIEQDSDEPSIWFDSLISGHDCKNEAIDATRDSSSPMTYPRMKKLLFEHDLSSPTCQNCLIHRHQVLNKDGAIIVEGRYVPPDCLFRFRTRAIASGLGFKLSLKQYGRVRFGEESGARVSEIMLTPELHKRISNVEPELIKDHQINISDDVAGQFLIQYGWSQTISNNSSLISVWRNSGLGRKEKMFEGNDSKTQISSFEAILDDIATFIGIAETSWVPLRYSNIGDVFSIADSSEEILHWPVLRVWCPPGILQLTISDPRQRLPSNTPIFIDDSEPIAADLESNSMMIELDNIALWR